MSRNRATIDAIMGLVSKLEMVGVLAGADPEANHGPERKALHAEIERLIERVAADTGAVPSAPATPQRLRIPSHLLDDLWLDARMWGVAGDGEPSIRQRKNLRAFAHIVRARVLDGIVAANKPAPQCVAQSTEDTPPTLRAASRVAVCGERIQALLRRYTLGGADANVQGLAPQDSTEVCVALISNGTLTRVVPRSEMKAALLLLIDRDDPRDATYTITYKAMPRAHYEALAHLSNHEGPQ